ncbi:spectrin beta chain, non-erythrocytic 1-like isoform X2 [Symsagittifera roscoffensis]|uniref:spectrin beta chain, non-erythrocytic 1-like isoform X2 n=1 Tax=Symsagittifera roscoffensis TaxID=84072 RepID=UPI00307C8E16
MTTDHIVRSGYLSEDLADDDENMDDMYDENSSARLFERQRIKALSDEREIVQKKTFTKWVNSHLAHMSTRANDLFIDLQDGRLLIKLLQILSGEQLPKPTRGRMRIHCLENVDKALTFLSQKRVHLENLGAQDIVDGSPRLTLGLIWTIILRFQIQDIQIETESQDTISAKEALLLWCQLKTAGYPGVSVRNFTTSWRDGLAFSALLNKHRDDIAFPREHPREKEEMDKCLAKAFKEAEQKLGIQRLLDPEDVNVEYPDEKSIITYVVTLYHYFSKARDETVCSKRIRKVMRARIDIEKLIHNYYKLVTDLLKWIEDRIVQLNDRVFANSLYGVQQQLLRFHSYTTVEKPPKFNEKGAIEMMFFQIRSQLSVHNMKSFTAEEGKTVMEINNAWQRLEKAEHGREIALRDELIRQERLEHLALRFDRKAAMRETWLTENQRIVKTENFGTDLAQIEASMKKHEAIETDILAYRERVNVILEVALDLERENYHEYKRINGRRDNVQKLWDDLFAMLDSRREKLNCALGLHRVFKEMELCCSEMAELRQPLMSDDYGKHLMGVEDLLQKHALLEAAVSAQNERMNAVNQKADDYYARIEEQSGEPPCKKEEIEAHKEKLNQTYEELCEMASSRHDKLEESKLLWQFFWDVVDEESWIKEKAQIINTVDIGNSLTSVQNLLNKHKALRDDIESHQTQLDEMIAAGQTLIDQQHFGSAKIQARIDEINAMWLKLKEFVELRQKRLDEATSLYRFHAEHEDAMAYMMDFFHIFSMTDCGQDESSNQALIKKHEDTMSEFRNFQSVLEDLHKHAQNLGEHERNSPDVLEKLSQMDKRYKELQVYATNRQGALMDASSLYKVFNESELVESWLATKLNFLESLVIQNAEDVDEIEILKHRYDHFEKEFTNNDEKVKLVNALANELINRPNPHPDADKVEARRDKLNETWERIRLMMQDKRKIIYQAYETKQFVIECTETITWIKEKAKLIQDTEALGNDLTAVIALQRRLAGMERDLSAIEGKIRGLTDEADRLCAEHPGVSDEIKAQIHDTYSSWADLRQILKDRDEQLDQSGHLQRFIRDLDDFEKWLHAKMNEIVNEETPETEADARQLQIRLNLIKGEIDNYEEQYALLKTTGDELTEGQDNPEYRQFRQRLEAADKEWDELHQIWNRADDRLKQLVLYMQLEKDGRAVESLLNKQDAFLAKVEKPSNIEQCNELIGKYKDLISTMDRNDEKVVQFLKLADDLYSQDNEHSPKAVEKANEIQQRRDTNRDKAEDDLRKLVDSLDWQKLKSDFHSLHFSVEDKNHLVDTIVESPLEGKKKFTKSTAVVQEVDALEKQLEDMKDHANNVREKHPELADEVDEAITATEVQLAETKQKAKDLVDKLFEEEKGSIFLSSIAELDENIGEVEEDEIPEECTNLVDAQIKMDQFNLIQKKLADTQSSLNELDNQQNRITDLPDTEQEEIKAKSENVKSRFNKVSQPLENKKKQLEIDIKKFKFFQDAADEKTWMSEKIPLCETRPVPGSLQEAEQLEKRNESLKNDIASHRPVLDAVIKDGHSLIDDEAYHNPQAVNDRIDDLESTWASLDEKLKEKIAELEILKNSQKYFEEAKDAEVWMSDQEFHLMSQDRGKDEPSAQALLKKHQALEKSIDDFEDTIKACADTAKELLEANHPDSPKIQSEQEKIEHSYANLKGLCEERKNRLEQAVELFKLNRDVDDLEIWINEREIVAGSHEMGQDLEHVIMLLDKFKVFTKDTTEVGHERVNQVSDACDAMIEQGHGDAVLIAEWKEHLNEIWNDLLELMDTRTQLLMASYDLRKFYSDCKDTLARIKEKMNNLPDDLGKDKKQVENLERKHESFILDVQSLRDQVHRITEEAGKFQQSYAGDKAREIQMREKEVVDAWNQLLLFCDDRRIKLADTGDLFRFYTMVRDLLNWMDDINRQIKNQEKPRDVSGVELLMNLHQAIKLEIDARDESFADCISLGKELIAKGHYALKEIKKKLLEIGYKRADLIADWEHRWEYLQLILEVYQYVKDAQAAEAWLNAQENYLKTQDLGDSVEAVEKLQKKHELFEKSLLAQTDRFHDLDRVTTLEQRELRRQKIMEYMKDHPDFVDEPTPISKNRKQFIEEYVAMHQLHDKEEEEEQLPSRPTVDHVHEPAASPSVQRPVQSSSAAPPEARARAGQASQPPASTVPESTAAAATQGSAAPASSAAKPTPAPPKSSDESVTKEGALQKKKDNDDGGVASKDRSWKGVYMVQKGTSLTTFKDQKSSKQNAALSGHAQIDLSTSECTIASDYTKKKNVFRLKTSTGAECLFMAKDANDMNSWVQSINTVCPTRESSTFPRSSSPSGGDAPDSGKKSAKDKKSATLKPSKK